VELRAIRFQANESCVDAAGRGYYRQYRELTRGAGNGRAQLERKQMEVHNRGGSSGDWLARWSSGCLCWQIEFFGIVNDAHFNGVPFDSPGSSGRFGTYASSPCFVAIERAVPGARDRGIGNGSTRPPL
jgi:hypothetical protein